jgi:hypothetical protein
LLGRHHWLSRLRCGGLLFKIAVKGMLGLMANSQQRRQLLV